MKKKRFTPKKLAVFTAVLLFVSLLASSCTLQKDTVSTSAPVREAIENDEPTEASESSAEEDSLTTDYTSGSPWLYSNIDGNVTSDTEVNLKDDFYLAVNKDAILEMEYLPGQTAVSTFDLLSASVKDNILEIIYDDSFVSHEAELLRTYYHLLDDWDSREPLMREYIAAILEIIDGIQTVKDYSKAIYDWKSDLILNDFLLFSIANASDEPDVYIPQCYSVLTLEDAAEYSERTENGQLTYNLQKAIYIYINEQLGFDTAQAEQDFDRMIAFEAKIAEHSMTIEEMMRAESIETMDNYMTLEELDGLFGDDFNLKGILEYNHFVSKRYLVPEPEQIRFIGTLFQDDSNIDEIKNWQKVQFLSNMAENLNKESLIHVQELTAQMQGTSSIPEYEKMLLTDVKLTLNIPMQIAYAERYVTPEMKEEITELCHDIIDEYKEMLLEEDWISDETKGKALEKLDAMKINALSPDSWIDYSELDISGMNFIEASRAIANYELDIICSMLNQKVDSNIWMDDITEANASYMLNDNSIQILAGIIGEGVYTSDMEKEELFGRMGMIIAHEISHAFDSTGSQFAADGTLSNWWSEEDLEQFNRRIEKVRTYYDNITIYEDKNLVGTMLDGEATADISGMQCLLRLAAKETDFDYDKMFRSYANLWCRKYIPYFAEYIYIYDVHPPCYLRVNTVLQQFDEFLETYGIQEGDGMYLAPEDRITVW